MNRKNLKFITILMVFAVIVVFTVCGRERPEGADSMMNLPPLKNDFSEYFDMGNILNPIDVSGGVVINNRLIRHYNVLTAENHMKPSYLSPTRDSYNFNTANNMVNSARASGFKVVGHTLLWHSQIPNWQAALRTNSTSREDALQYMKNYITTVVGEFKGRVYKWDVLNEAFPDGGFTGNWRTSMRSGNSDGNPWFMKIGADFVYEGFLAARLADPDAILYYNDYNMNIVGKSTMVRDMVRDVNAQYLASGDKPAGEDPARLLIEGIGLQSHHNTGVSPASVSASIALFRPLGVRLSISELDVLSQSWGEYSSSTPPTDAGKARAAELYGDYFEIFLNNADIIERVTFWGVYDEQSWRARAQPLIFEGNSVSTAKQSYFNIIKALNAVSP